MDTQFSFSVGQVLTAQIGHGASIVAKTKLPVVSESAFIGSILADKARP